MENKIVKVFNNLQFMQFVKDLGFSISSDKELNDPTPEFIQNLLIEVTMIFSHFFFLILF